MNRPEITINETTGVVTYKLNAQDAVELGYILQDEGRRMKDRGWLDDGDELFKLADGWLERKRERTR